MLPRVMVVLLGFLFLLPSAGFSTIHQVDITGSDFVPIGITITQGDTVRWTNNDGIPHTSASDGGVWNSPNLFTGQSYSFAFTASGSFPYHCAVHPSMRDTITVVAPADFEIGIGDNFFDPPVVQINNGETVRWTNNGAMTHTATALDGAFDSGDLIPGASFSFTFTQEGVHDYECSFHAGMVGTIIVGTPDSVVQDIQMFNTEFVPATVSVTVGQYVRWINLDPMAHTSTDTSAGLWDSGMLEPGDFFVLQANAVGSFDYICSFHSGMAGHLVVQDTTAAGGCAYTPGDINGNGLANGIDVVFGVSYLKGGPLPPIDCNPPCTGQSNPFFAAMDVNGNCTTNGIDITYFVAYLKGIQPTIQHCASCPPATAVGRASR